jgi:hypothetical protein
MKKASKCSKIIKESLSIKDKSLNLKYNNHNILFTPKSTKKE